MWGGGGVGVLVLLTFGSWGGGGVVQNRESPDFRSPEVGRYARQSWILDSIPWILDSRYYIQDSLTVEIGFRIPIISGIPDSLTVFRNTKPRIQDSTSKNFLYSGLCKQNFLRFRNPDFLKRECGIKTPLRDPQNLKSQD